MQYETLTLRKTGQEETPVCSLQISPLAVSGHLRSSPSSKPRNTCHSFPLERAWKQQRGMTRGREQDDSMELIEEKRLLMGGMDEHELEDLDSSSGVSQNTAQSRCGCECTVASTVNRQQNHPSSTPAPRPAGARINKLLAYTVIILSIVILYLISVSPSSTYPFPSAQSATTHHATATSGDSQLDKNEDPCPDPYHQPGCECGATFTLRDGSGMCCRC